MMKAMMMATVLITLFVSKDLLTGKWVSTPSVKGNVTSIVFKNDSLFEAFVNRKPFATGKYRFTASDSSLSFVDNGCNSAEAVYKILFFSNADSMRFKAISDTCTERKNGMQRLTMGRVKLSIASNFIKLYNQ
jgi:hypothetical protein